ncbi:Bug family tripartite tricarboxylate transporter substrate binding protein [Phaeovulum sp.]|uniref:Bug family tripartite tricarboxylate transporter substrate binding protein n=1 Tax=Phaeovulum sp. TaxID=2934796 RepID=UPI0039E54BD2
MKFIHLKALGASALISLAASQAMSTECIAPADPGGGWDFTCRQVGKILYDLKLVPKPVQVTNMAGAGGGLAYAHVVNARNTDEDLIVAASSATTARLAQNAYGGATADQVRFLGAIAGDPGVIVVANDSPYQTLSDLIDAIKADPASVTFAGGSAAGGFDHLKPLQLLKAAGFEDMRLIKYVGMNGGAEAITQTIGGHTQAMTGDISEITGFIKSGDVRPLAVLTRERVPGFEDIPTAKEQGFDVEVVNWRGFYVPKGISDDAFTLWAGRLQEVADSAEWQEVMVKNGLAPFTLVGDDFQDWVDGVVAETTELSKEIGVIQ